MKSLLIALTLLVSSQMVHAGGKNYENSVSSTSVSITKYLEMQERGELDEGDVESLIKGQASLIEMSMLACKKSLLGSYCLNKVEKVKRSLKNDLNSGVLSQEVYTLTLNCVDQAQKEIIEFKNSK